MELVVNIISPFEMLKLLLIFCKGWWSDTQKYFLLKKKNVFGILSIKFDQQFIFNIENNIIQIFMSFLNDKYFNFLNNNLSTSIYMQEINQFQIFQNISPKSIQ